MREADKERKAKRTAAMTKEEKSAVKEEDRLRKAMKKISQVRLIRGFCQDSWPKRKAG